MIKLALEWEQRIRVEAQRTYPDECCGILLGNINADDTKTVTDILPVDNGREKSERYHRFEIDAETLMHAEVEARTQHKEVVGFYHSHPDHPAVPSEFDKEHALPYYSYIIVETVKDTTKAFTSWELTADRSEFRQETCYIAEK
jgi:proteasome lid subunit RPN8/RPN11